MIEFTQTTGMPLSKIKVLDLTRVRAGPTCVRQLADWGADVIKIELPPDGKEDLVGARHGFDFQNLHRNKRSLTLDLKAREAKEIFNKLVGQSDVVVENYAKGVFIKLGLGYEDLRQVKPDIIMFSMPLFGNTGPYSHYRGMGATLDPVSGHSTLRGYPGEDVLMCLVQARVTILCEPLRTC